jgi:hypothetical protein
MAFTTLTSHLLKISNIKIGLGGTIAAGTQLTSATLTTIDQDSGPLGPLQLNPDPYSLGGSETLSFRINGVQVADTFPNMFATSIVTNSGTFTVLAFIVGNDTYLLPQGSVNIGSISTITAPALLNSVPVTGIQAADYGFLPENANTFTGKVFSQVTEFGSSGVTSHSVTAATVYDADHVRGNADSVGEEVGTGALHGIGSGVELTTTLLFNDGTSLSGVEAVNLQNSSAYGPTVDSFIFNAADLAAVGKSLNDIASVTARQVIDHSLNWADLGFQFVSAGNGIVTADPATPPPLNQIFGTNANNALVGTDGRDVFHGLGGNDTYDGRAGNDAFVFGAETRNGRRETDTIRNYEVGKDAIYFEDAAVIKSVVDINGGVRITFAGDGDRLDVFGTGVNHFNVGIYADDFLV